MTAVPVLRLEREKDVLVQTDNLTWKWSFYGTNTGDWRDGTKATNKSFKINGLTLLKVKNGKIIYPGGAIKLICTDIFSTEFHKGGNVMNKNTEQLMELIESETKKRIDIYHDFEPGSKNAEVTPFTMKKAYPAIYFTLILIALYIWGAVSVFPRYFPDY